MGAILIEQAWAEPWMSVFSRMGMHGTSVGGVTVYPTGNPGAGRQPDAGEIIRAWRDEHV